MESRKSVGNTFGSAQFLTAKFRVSSLKTSINVHDFQLRDHFVNVNDIYSMQCGCRNHKHNKIRCTITDERQCRRCGTGTRLLLKYESMLFHGEALLSENQPLYACCVHTHTAPCGRCCNCNTIDEVGSQIANCVMAQPTFECICTTDMVCPHHQDRFTTLSVRESDMIREHVYNTKLVAFYFCLEHKHYHRAHPNVVCYIQTYQCCEKAVSVREYRSSFIVTLNDITRKGEPAKSKLPAATRRARKRKLTSCENGDVVPSRSSANANECIGVKAPNTQEYIIFDPSIWRDQSFNHFISFIRAVITIPSSAKMRYSRFEMSNFAISNIKKYKSGKESVSRTLVTGFETKGIYQTSTISCTLPYYKTLIPHTLWRILKEQHYDLDLVCVKRDPSIKPTCMFVCRAELNPNPNINTIVIPDALAIGLNQDQDGDKNAIYVLPTRHDDYDRRNSYAYAIAKMELERAFRRTVTLIAQPRYFISETNLLHIRRSRESFSGLRFAERAIDRGSRFMIDAGCGYLREEYELFLDKLIEINARPHHTYVTANDLLLRTDRLPSIFESGAKGTREHLKILLNRIADNRTTLQDCESDMIALVNKYVSSSQELSRNGRNQFASLYAGSDLIIFDGMVYHNKLLLADYTTFGSVGALMWSTASLQLFTEDLFSL